MDYLDKWPCGATYKAAIAKYSLHDTGDEGCAVQAPFIFGYRHEFVHQGLLLDNVISTFVVVGVLQLVGLPTEQRLPYRALHKQQHVKQLYLAFATLLSYHEQIGYPVPDFRTDLRQSSHNTENNVTLVSDRWTV